MRDTECNQSDVAYESKGEKEAKDPTLVNHQFPGDKMPQNNKMVKQSQPYSDSKPRYWNYR